MKTNNQINLLKRAKEKFGYGAKEIKKTSNKNVFEVLFFSKLSLLWNPENEIFSQRFSTKSGYKYLEKLGLFVLNDTDQYSSIWNPEKGVYISSVFNKKSGASNFQVKTFK